MGFIQFAVDIWQQSSWLVFLTTVAITYLSVVANYRLFFHPLANVPGPRIAALTIWWEVYENVWKGGNLPFKLKRLHEIYGPVTSPPQWALLNYTNSGPIIRISPNGVHIADPSAYERIYYVGTPFGKDEWYYQVAFGPATFFTTGDNAKHREGREPLGQFFSRRNVVGSMQKIVQAEVARCSQRIEKVIQERKPVPIHRIFRCITTDVVTEVAWGWDDRLILKNDFAARFHDNLAVVQHAMWSRLYFPTVTRLLSLLPPKVIGKMDEAVGNFLGVFETCRNQVIRIKEETHKIDYSEPPTIFHALLDDQSVVKGKREESVDYMTGIGALIYVAGVETTAHAMTSITYYILKYPEITRQLQRELDEAFPTEGEEMTLVKLEALPYLTAVIYEGLRISFGVASRLPRIVPPAGFQYKNFYLPPGVQVGMSSYDIHTDETIFPDPFTYNPNRWIGKVKKLEKYLVSFSKGSRQCLGMNLAFCELYLTVAMLFKRFDMTIYETNDSDMKITADFFNAWPSENARLLQVKASVR